MVVTHLLTHSLIHLLTYSLTHLLTHSLTHSNLVTTNFEVIYKELFEIAAKIIKNEFGLSLFGFDVIISDDNKTEQVRAVRTYLLTHLLTHSLRFVVCR